MQITFNLPHVFNPDSPSVSNGRALRRLLDCLVNINLDYLVENPNTPALYRSGVIYERTSWWEPIPAVIARGGGDCKSLATWRLAELRNKGIPAKTVFRWNQRADGQKDFHILIMTSKGWEDPSKILGMGKNETQVFVPNPLTGGAR